jgi:hypothetical protein
VKRSLLIVSMALVVVLLTAVPAVAGPWWKLSARTAPTNLPAGGRGLIEVAADDLGDDGVTGATHPVTIKDVLPQGLVVSDPSAVNPHRARAGNRGSKEERALWTCSVAQGREVTCSTGLAIPAYEVFEVEIPVEAQEPAGTETTLTNQASVEGGEAEAGGTVPGASISRPVRISDEPVTFGLEEGGYAIAPEDAEGKLDTEAGSHPFQLTSTVDFNEVLEEVQEPGEPALLQPSAPGLAKNLTFSLPPGLLGNVTAATQCSELDFAALKSEGNSCPASSAIGVATVTVLEPSRADYITKAVPLFNLEPALGEPARFGFEAVRVPVVLDASVRTDGDYGVTVDVNNATEAAQVLGATVTFWGDPSSASHDSSRGWACLRGGLEAFEGEVCGPPASRSQVPFLTLPTSCTGPLSTTMEGIAWNGSPIAGSFAFQNGLGGPLESLTGCAGLPFDASIAVQPEQPAENGAPRAVTESASTATGLEVTVATDQHGTLTDGEPADADVQSTTVTLPAGMQLNPSAANGLEACSEQQIGYEGPATGADPFEPGASEPLQFSNAPVGCPQASKLGTVRIKTPLLGEELSGGVYLAAQEANPFGSLIALYVVAESKTLGLQVKLAGEGKLNEQNGQITTVFQDTPQVPFERLTVNFFGGANGSLGTPARCGTYATTAVFTSWAGALLDTETQSPFSIVSGPGGAPCPGVELPFVPSFDAGSVSLRAGGFTPFTVTLGNPDGDQPLAGLSVHLPPGIAAMLSRVTPCVEPPSGQEWACGPGSLIGHSVAESGLGGSPVSLAGSVFLTVGYGGAPFGILVVTPAVAGPFDLGDVDVRSRILVDQNTAAVTIASDPFPLFVKGVPVDLKQIQVTVDRPEFEFNPTHCTPEAITATLTGAEGASVQAGSRFQVDGCAALPFKPTLTASTQGKTSKVDGASLTVKVTSSSGQANIAKTVVTLPKALPSRLSTLQLACVAKTFQENPAACPEGSFIGTATVHTPVLKSPLTGPAILVSHGGESFPDVEFLLQGEGIELVLDGKTHIKDGITTSSFNTVPDAPVTSFETVLPEGPHSILGAISDLCTSKLVMPTVMSAQNGAVIEKDTPIAVTGCSGVKGSTSRQLSQTQKRTRALAACRRKYRHEPAKRASCERAAKRRYPTKTKKN